MPTTAIQHLEHRVEVLYIAAYRLSCAAIEHDVIEASDDATAIMAWARAWQEQMGSRSTTQKVPTPRRLSRMVTPF